MIVFKINFRRTEGTIQRHRQHWAQDTEQRQTKQKTLHRKLKR